MTTEKSIQTAKLSMKLIAPSGYTSETTCEVFPEQWGDIQRICDNKESGLKKRTLAIVDPNAVFATRTFEVTFQQWDYSLTLPVRMGDGFSSIDILFEELADRLVAEQGENPELILKRPSMEFEGEDTLICSPDGDPIETWLRDMVVSVAIVSLVPEGGAA